MADLLPSMPDLSGADDAEPKVVGVDSDEADAMLSALSSQTARILLTHLHEEPDTASGLAARTDTTLQNVQYHIGNLSDADLVTVADTVYSEKGREMKVYAPADRPLVVYAGREDDTLGLKQALSRLLGGVALLGVLSLLVQVWLRGFPSLGLAATGGAAGSADGGDVSLAAAETTKAAETAAGLPPGLVFFLGGAAVLAVAFAAWYWRANR